MENQVNESSSFAANSSEVAVKIIDGEAVAIDVLTGKYHGMGGTACRIMELISRGSDLGQVLDVLESRYALSRDLLRSDLFKFIQQLLDQRILIPRQAQPSTAPADAPDWDHTCYAPPILETYDDMAELLALDPPMPTVLDTPWSGGHGVATQIRTK